jgi:hypothetical protein
MPLPTSCCSASPERSNLPRTDQLRRTWCVTSWYRSSGCVPSVMSRSNTSSQDLGFLPSLRARRSLQAHAGVCAPLYTAT